MKSLLLFGRILTFLAVCTSLASSDSLELRNGRHLQGRYVGGTSTVVGFMTGSAIEYFATSDVLALIFERNLDSPLSGTRPDPMKRNVSPRISRGNTRQVNAQAGEHKSSSKPRLTQASALLAVN